MNKLDSEPLQALAVNQLAAGMSQHHVAQTLGISQPTVSRFVSRPDISVKIKDEQRRLLDALPDAVENLKALVVGFKVATDAKERKLGFDASLTIIKASGILEPSQAKPEAGLSPSILRIVSAGMAALAAENNDDEPIDLEKLRSPVRD